MTGSLGIRGARRGALPPALLALLIPLLAGSAAPAEDPSSAADGILEAVKADEDLPSISAAVSLDGRIVYARALGYADLENEVPATPETVYPIGSVTKTLTAVAALRLAEQGKLDLDAPVERYCPAFPAKSQAITVRQLLAHTGGIRHYDYRRFEEDFLNRRHFDSIAEALAKFRDDPLVGEPGAGYHYSSWGYVLAGCAIEGAGGAGYFDIVRSTVIERAGMESTRPDVVADLVPHRARGYSRKDSGELVNAGLFDASDRYPAGGYLSTPADLARFGSALAAGKLLGEPSLRRMWSSAATSDGAGTGHGLGWNLHEGGEAVSHGGTTVGATTYLYVRPGRRLAVAIAVNLSLWSGKRHELAERLAVLFSSVGGAS